MKNKILPLLCIIALFLTSCGKSTEQENITSNKKYETATIEEITLSSMDLNFTDNDIDSSANNENIIIPKDNNRKIEISADGIYKISGKYSQIIIDAPKTSKPRVILENAEISCENGPAIYVKTCDKAFITIAENSRNTLSDGESYDSSYDNADGVIFSKSDLTINGKGSLEIKGNYKCGIVSKDDLNICQSTITVNSKGAAFEGKDCLKIKDATINISSCTDGLKATNEEHTDRGFIYIESGKFDINSTNDGLQAATALIINNGEFNIKTGGGSVVSSNDNNRWGMWSKDETNNPNDSETTESAKGLKSSFLIKINDGNFNIDSSDDAIHSNSDIEINGGNFEVISGDDGVHADDQLIINDGNIKISKSYEGIEATAITVNSGKIDITSSDDGFNAAGGNDGSALGNRPGQNPFDSNSDAQININGGYIMVNASGDGIDSNGTITMNNGILLVSGPENNGNGSLDYGISAEINGGTAFILGSSGMATSFSQNSVQPSFMQNLDTTVSGDTIVSVTKDDKVLISFKSKKHFNNVIASCSDFKIGEKYSLNFGGEIKGTDENGYSKDTKHTNIQSSTEIELTSVSTSNGQSGGMGGPDGGGMRPNKGYGGEMGQMPPDGNGEEFQKPDKGMRNPYAQ